MKIACFLFTHTASHSTRAIFRHHHFGGEGLLVTMIYLQRHTNGGGQKINCDKDMYGFFDHGAKVSLPM